MYVNNPLLSEGPGKWIPLSDGEKGIDETVDVMRQLVYKSLADPAVKAAAMEAAKDVRPTDVEGYAKAVWRFVRARMKYVPDTWKIEEVTSPAIHSRRILASGSSWGDCDDFSVTGAAWLISLGVPARFAVVASLKNFGRFDHVRAEARTPRGWVPLETTMKALPYGKGVANVRTKVYEV